MTKAKYTDGFVLLVPKRKLPEYLKMAKTACKIWMDHGAIDYKECVADDMNIPMGVSFPKLAKAKAGEVVVFAWITYKSAAHRKSVNAKVHKDPRMDKFSQMYPNPKDMPFDCKRMSVGGFKIAVSK